MKLLKKIKHDKEKVIVKKKIKKNLGIKKKENTKADYKLNPLAIELASNLSDKSAFVNELTEQLTKMAGHGVQVVYVPQAETNRRSNGSLPWVRTLETDIGKEPFAVILIGKELFRDSNIAARMINGFFNRFNRGGRKYI